LRQGEASTSADNVRQCISVEEQKGKVTGTKLFAYVRVLGVRKLLAWMTARRFRRRVRERCGQDWGPLKTSAGMVLFAASFPAAASLASSWAAAFACPPKGRASATSN
jgi:hypothetical protein